MSHFISWLRIERSLVVVVLRHVAVDVKRDVLILSGGLVDEKEFWIIINQTHNARYLVVSESVE